MAYQVTLTDEDYAALSAAATQRGAPIAELVHEAIAAQYTAAPRLPSGVYSYPTGEPISAEEKAEMERLAVAIGSEHPWASEMVIEDRGPR